MRDARVFLRRNDIMATHPPQGSARTLGSEPMHPPGPLVGVPHEAWRTDVPEARADASQVIEQSLIEAGSSFELLCTVIAVPFAIAGLAGYFPVYLASLAAIAVGFALLAQGSTIAARWRHALHIEGRERIDRIGMSTEMFGGFAAIVLGVIAVFGMMSLILLPVAAIVLGAALLLGGPTQPDLAEDATVTARRHWHVTRDAMRASSGVMVMGGLGAIVLGILAVSGVGPALPLALTALLCVAMSLMLSGGSLLALVRKKLA
jgi:hypothetical protein